MSRSVSKLWNYSLVPGTFKSHFGDEIPYLWKVNLREIWSHSPSEFPGCSEDNVIYCIHNDKNGKCYVGQARNLFNRFYHNICYNHFDSYIEGDNRVLYKAINKYKPQQFTVYILMELSESDELDRWEIYWIDKLQSCIYIKNNWGYNATSGGDNCEALHSKSSIAKSLRTNRENHGGVLFINTEESRNINRNNHGGILAWNTPEAQEHAHKASLKSNLEIGNGDSAWMLHNQSVYEKRYNTMMDEYGDPMGMANTIENRTKAYLTRVSKLCNRLEIT